MYSLNYYMKHLFKSITKTVVEIGTSIQCEHGELNLQQDLFIPIDDIIKGAMMDELGAHIINEIIVDSIDLTRISRVEPRMSEVKGIIELSKTLKTDIAFVGSMAFTHLKEHMRKTVSTDFREHSLGMSSHIDIISGGEKLTIYCVPQFKWDYDYIHLLNPIELDGELSEYLKFTKDGIRFELSLEPIKTPISYKIKICP